MNGTMKAAARVIARARDLISESGRDHRITGAVVPEPMLDALAESLDDYDIAARQAMEQDWWNWFLGEGGEDETASNFLNHQQRIARNDRT